MDSTEISLFFVVLIFKLNALSATPIFSVERVDISRILLIPSDCLAFACNEAIDFCLSAMDNPE